MASEKQRKAKTARAVTIRTYLPEKDIEEIIAQHAHMVCVAYMATHDKDKNEDGTPIVPHVHVNLLLDRSRQLSGTLSWFKASDSEGRPIQTHVEAVLDPVGCDDYLTHNTDEARAKGKYQYDEEIIKVIRGERDTFREFRTDWVRKHEARIAKEANAEEVDQLLQDIIDGVPAREMARRYGRDYVKNVKAYRHYAGLVVWEEEGDLTKADKIANGGGLEYLIERERNNAMREGMATALKVLHNHCSSRIKAGDTYLKDVAEDIKTMLKAFD